MTTTTKKAPAKKKARRGRPPKLGAEKLTHTIAARFTDAEYELVAEKAAISRHSLGTYVALSAVARAKGHR